MPAAPDDAGGAPRSPRLEEDEARCGSKRQRYVSQACTECKKRKIRCSGDLPCTQCASGVTECEYPAARRGGVQHGRGEGQRPPRPPRPARNTDIPAVADASWQVEVLTQLRAISARLDHNRDHDHDHDAPSAGGTAPDPASPGVGHALGGGASPPTVAEPPPSVDGGVPAPPCPLALCPDAATCYFHELQLWQARTRDGGMAVVRESVNTYFACLNPHYPCLDASSFKANFQLYIDNPSSEEAGVDRVQFIALLYFILAVVKILDDFCTDEGVIPGAAEFARAEHLLGHIIRAHRGNLVTLQCLILKSSFLLYVERPDRAYDEMASAVRLCFQLGLHNQKSWRNVFPFDVVMRQRIFWCIFCLERNVSHACGAPYQIRESDICVELPPAINLGPDGVADEAENGFSPIPHLLATIKWAKLCSEMWDLVFGVSAQPITAGFVAVMDARILLLLNELPEYLRWSPDLLEDADYLRFPPFILRQCVVLHLRANHLRLVLWHSDLLSPKVSGRGAAICVEAASSSIEAVHKYHNCPLKSNIERYSAAAYLPGTIIALSCVILNSNIEHALRVRASLSFGKGVQILEDIAPGFTLGRRVLERLHAVIIAARKTNSDLGLVDQVNLNSVSTVAQSRSAQASPAFNNGTTAGSNLAYFGLELDDIFQMATPRLLEDSSNPFMLNSLR